MVPPGPGQSDGKDSDCLAASLLVVDDSASVRDRLVECLSTAGYRVTEADNGEEGLEIARRDDFDMFIIDVHMPLLNGLDMLGEIRKIERHAKTPAFMLTTESSPELVAHGRVVGATAWIVKPFHDMSLVKGVEYALKRARSAA